tara:strand:- start:1818 stop:2789 length:972 start_codon:yes stop_codon:yes gene_type:complete
MSAHADEPKIDHTHSASLVLLGTAGGPVLRTTRSQPASMLVVNGDVYLIDAGDGASAQITKSGHSLPSVRAVFLTHHHMDHTAGLAGVLAFNWSVVRQTPLFIYGPPGTEALVQRGLSYFSISEDIFKRESPAVPGMADNPRPADIHGGGDVYEDENIRVIAAENSHFHNVCHDEACPELKSFSYRFEIKGGNKPTSVVFTGDTGPSKSVVELAKDTDVLVSEIIDLPSTVIFLRDYIRLPEASLTPMVAHMETEHLTPEEVGKLARDSGAKTVVLNHFVWGNQDKEPDVEKLTNVVSKVYGGNIIPGYDLQVIDLQRSNKVE